MQEDEIAKLTKIYSVHDDVFEQYKKKAWLTLTTGKRPSKDKTLIIVGGQSGAGKSRLIPIAKKRLNNNAVVVDFDELRSLHPYYKQVNENYTEVTHRILHPDTERVKNEILKRLIAENYNVVYEGALRNTQGFLDFAKDFRDAEYDIRMFIMAVPKLESYGSTFLRYAMASLTNTTPRWVEKSAHDGSYEGVKRTVGAFIEEKIVDGIEVFVRDAEKPKSIYTTEGREYKDALAAIDYGREIGRKKAVKDFQRKYDTVISILQGKEPNIEEKLADWVELYESEWIYFDDLIQGISYDD